MDFRRLMDYIAVKIHRTKNHIARNSGLYRRIAEKKEKIERDRAFILDETEGYKKDLRERDSLLEYQYNNNVKLSEENKKFEIMAVSAETERARAMAEKDALEKRMEKTLPKIKDIVTEILQNVSDVRTGRDIIEARVNASRTATNSLVEWQKAYADPLERKMKAAEQEAYALRGAAFRTAIDIVVRADSRAQEVPFVYYDFVNKTLIYTPATLKYLHVEEEEIGKLTLGKFLRFIRTDKKKTKEIVSAIRTGKRIAHYAVKSEGTDELMYLTSYPVSYTNEGKTKAVGVGIFLYDPGFRHLYNLMKKPEGTRELEKTIDGMIESLGEALRGLKAASS